MSTYCDTAGLLARFDREPNKELTDLTGGPGAESPDAARLLQALQEASGEMDQAFRVRYAVPLTGYSAVTGARLAQVCADIARYRLWGERAAEEVRTRYEDARDWLRAIAQGTYSLDAAAPDATGATASSPAHSAPAPTFSPTTLTDY